MVVGIKFDSKPYSFLKPDFVAG